MFSTILEVLGFVLITAAAVLVTVPLGLAVGGVSLITLGYLIGRR